MPLGIIEQDISSYAAFVIMEMPIKMIPGRSMLPSLLLRMRAHYLKPFLLVGHMKSLQMENKAMPTQKVYLFCLFGMLPTLPIYILQDARVYWQICTKHLLKANPLR